MPMGGFDGQHWDGRPVLPAGRHVWLPRRGRTFVRQLDGPPGAPVVVLLHGWTATADLNWFACYEPLAEHFGVVALDHRGHGRGIRSLSPFRLEDCADDVAALADELGLTNLIVAGYSMGGPIAQLLWRRHRRLVDGLVLCATGCSFGGSARERLLAGVATGTGVLAGALPLERMTSATLATWHQWRCRRGRPWWGYDDIARHGWSQIVAAGRALLRFDSRPWIGDVDVPVAVVVTTADDVVPTRRQLAMVGALADVTRYDVDGGHAVCSSAPERFVPSLVQACLDVAARTQAGITVAA